MKKLRYEKDVEYLFVDGYNIINFWDSFKDDSISLEDKRLKLMDVLTEYAHMTTEEIILVFDGYMVKKSPGAIYDYNGITVVFTKELETADHFIEHELNEIGRVRKVRVATSDNVEQQIILSRGGSRISAREFEIEVENSMRRLEVEQKNLKENASRDISAMDEENIRLLKNFKKNIGT
ncbi:NYN domain-containing protein [Anaerosphaera multitolerans]|uniref:NYN domain-containing protein n=1 Tax=Anaerosphaera multitolerans TaxID=2487351 RepID=A0A437S7M8_9FIRM|nr:NYN domain-containing protein [Anaerosphaera multitolerans]RVU55066.1 NYN domain-containing protein [Anaerosphaera multitolerans]